MDGWMPTMEGPEMMPWDDDNEDSGDDPDNYPPF